jgi:hypothetical protein
MCYRGPDKHCLGLFVFLYLQFFPTNYTWQQVKKRKISNQTSETKTVGNPVLFNTQNRYEELSRLSDENMQTNETDETATNTKYIQLRESKPPPIYTIRGNKPPRNGRTPSYNERTRKMLLKRRRAGWCEMILSPEAEE